MGKGGRGAVGRSDSLQRAHRAAAASLRQLSDPGYRHDETRQAALDAIYGRKL